LVVSATAWFILAAGAIAARQVYLSRPGYGLPFYARFTPDVEDRWTALGGTWEVVDGSMRNDSNDRGAKLLTGSPSWRDYVVEGDLQLLGEGSVGVLARVSDAELGENSHKGYFAGVRTADNSLVLGAYDFAYHEAAKLLLPDPVRPFRWYHVKLRAVGCRITAFVRADGMPEVQTAPVNDPDCFRSGSIGLRSNGTGGVWRNVSVVPVEAAAASAALNLPLPDATAFQQALLRIRAQRSGTPALREAAPPVPPQPVRTLLYLPPFGSPLTSVRGTVVLTRPAVYVQDSTGGGVEIQSDNATPLKIGDEVEVTGEISLDKVSPVMRRARFRLLREAVPASPMVLTANQVAEGQYDGMFVQVEGYLRSISTRNDGTLTMRLDGGAQSFQAILPTGRSRSHLQGLAPQSRLRVRGVSVVDARFNQDADPFAILVRAAEDVEVVAGPPWWRPSTLILASLVALGLIFALNHVYLLAQHWRLRAVADERERLAHEIHDTLAQSFAGIGFQLQAIRNSMPRDAQVLERQVDRAILMARTSHEEARRSIATLHPESLGHVGLLRALRECAERMVKSGNVSVEIYGEDDPRVVPVHIKDALFRIGQEAIANSIRHAEPGTIRIGLQQQRASLCLSVEDNGQGFVADSDHAGFGLLGMYKRAESISATLVIKSAPGSGTRVEVKTAVGPRFLGMAWRRRGQTKYRGIPD
jgi:signal transduction histidine kinase